MTVKELQIVRNELTQFYNNMSKQVSTETTIFEVMGLRKYVTEEMYETLMEMGIWKVNNTSDIFYYDKKVTEKQLKLWGLLTDNGDFLLKGRYVIPVRNISGQVISLIGWFPDFKKYITAPTVGFSRDTSFYNLDCYQKSIEEYGGLVFLVEGIFDTIAGKSLGLPFLGNMGLELSPIKTEILTRFNKVVAIPDNDKAGASVIPYKNSFSGKATKFVWNIKNEHIFTILPHGIKDMDDYIRDYDCYDELLSCREARYIKKLKLV